MRSAHAYGQPTSKGEPSSPLHEARVNLAEPEILTILLRDVNDPDLWGKELEQRLFAFTSRLAEIFGDAKKRGFLRKDTDPLIAAAMIYMPFSGLIQFGVHLRRVSSLTLDDAAARRELVEKALQVLFDGVLK